MKEKKTRREAEDVRGVENGKKWRENHPCLKVNYIYYFP